jgi:hypothetical protein
LLREARDRSARTAGGNANVNRRSHLKVYQRSKTSTPWTTSKIALAIVISELCVATFATASPIVITQTVNSATLAGALPGTGGLTVDSIAINNGAGSQFGTYSGFSLIANGLVLSTGQVAQVVPGFNNGVQGSATTPSTDTGTGGTTEFNAYGPSHIANFVSSNDVAALTVNFTLATASQVGFDFIFGSVEFPQFTSDFTDAFLAFLDGTAAGNQIAFDASHNAVQVGATFAGALNTANTDTAFSSPHGLLALTTFTTVQLAAGSHSLKFEVGDVNDHILDSAVFLANLRAAAGEGGTNPTTPTTPAAVPEPATCGLFGLGLAAFAVRRRLMRRS